jgi:hypothetical protein
MAHAAVPAVASSALQQHSRISLQLGSFTDEIRTTPASSILTVSGSGRGSNISRSLGWAFGQGFMGQTCIYEVAGTFYEAHLSFFTSSEGLDITPGQIRSLPANIEAAAGCPMSADETRLCFGCHTTESAVNDAFDPHQSIPGSAAKIVTARGRHTQF